MAHGVYIIQLQFLTLYRSPELWKLVDSRESYCNNKQVYFFGSPSGVSVPVQLCETTIVQRASVVGSQSMT